MSKGLLTNVNRFRSGAGLLAATMLTTALFSLALPTAGLALSELKPGEAPVEAPAAPAPAPGIEVPAPEPIPPAGAATPEVPEPDQEQAQPVPDEEGAIARPDIDPDAPLPQVEYDLTKLPEPVQRMRQLLVDVAVSGDIEKLRPLIGAGESAPLLSLSQMTDDDPIVFLKSLSGDPDGQEILAIMEEVLDAGYVHLHVGTPEELYVWPYFFGLPLDNLNGRQKVELYKIITAGDYEEMSQYGNYLFYRLGITPKGEWAFFVGGE